MRPLIALVLSVAVSACEEEFSGEAMAELGAISESGAYAPFADGDELRIVNGTQGGYWVMPTLRSRGMPEKTLVRSQVLLEGEGEPLSDAVTEGYFDSGSGDWLQITRFGIFLTFEQSVAETLNGRRAHVSCDVRGMFASRAASTEAAVTLVLETF